MPHYREEIKRKNNIIYEIDNTNIRKSRQIYKINNDYLVEEYPPPDFNTFSNINSINLLSDGSFVIDIFAKHYPGGVMTQFHKRVRLTPVP